MTKKAESVGVTAFADVTFVLDDAQTKARKCCSSSDPIACCLLEQKFN